MSALKRAMRKKPFFSLPKKRDPAKKQNHSAAAPPAQDSSRTAAGSYPNAEIIPICSRWKRVLIAWGYRGLRSKKGSVAPMLPVLSIPRLSPASQLSSEWTKGKRSKKQRETRQNTRM